MAEYMWAKIKIGGNISLPILSDLVEKFGIAAPSLEEAASASYIEIESMEARWGQFEEMEDFLEEQSVAFDRLSDGRYEYSPELRRFRPPVISSDGSLAQTPRDSTFLCDHDNRPMILLQDIHKALTETKTREELAARLTDLCGLEIPTLLPLTIVSAAYESNDPRLTETLL
jgi:hypothetical protein